MRHGIHTLIMSLLSLVHIHMNVLCLVLPLLCCCLLEMGSSHYFLVCIPCIFLHGLLESLVNMSPSFLRSVMPCSVDEQISYAIVHTKSLYYVKVLNMSVPSICTSLPLRHQSLLHHQWFFLLAT